MNWNKLYRWLVYLSLVVGGAIVGFAVVAFVVYLFQAFILGVFVSISGNMPLLDSSYWEPVWGTGIVGAIIGFLTCAITAIKPDGVFCREEA